MAPQHFKQAIDAGLFDVIVDVRSEGEFNTGYIEGATLVANLATTGAPADLLMGCHNCTLGVYCTAGVRARGAIQRLIAEYDFPVENLYNGQGTSQWTGLGYPLVTGPTTPALCNADPEYQCLESGERPQVINEMTAVEFNEAIASGQFDAVIDIRRQDEWDLGHLPNVTFVTNLASDGEIDRLLGCENCQIGLYCRSGNRVRSAIGRMSTEFGFNADNLYNGLGVRQWTEAGFELVTDQESVPAVCEADLTYECKSCCKENATANSFVDNMTTGGDDSSRAAFILSSSLVAIVVPAVLSQLF